MKRVGICFERFLRFLTFTALIFLVLLSVSCKAKASAESILDKQALLEKESFWDNQDFDWYKANIPFFECPDNEIATTYYYRWELVTKHLVYGSPEDGYSSTEFIDRPGWSGTYGAISCPAGHQLYELRWLRDPVFANDYSKYWFRVTGAEPRKYSCWIADSVWQLYKVRNDKEFAVDILGDLIGNYKVWERDHWVEDVGMFWQHGMADGMETNINSRQTKNWFAGARGYRPTLNSYMYADALGISQIAKLAGKDDIAEQYAKQASGIKERVQAMLWDPQREFFFHMFMEDENVDDPDREVIKAMTLTYQSGEYAGNEHGREEIGYVPWQFNMLDAGYEAAWKFLMDPNYFYAERGPLVTERNDPLFSISPNCCVWSGNSWPFATTQTLKAMANLLNNYKQDFVDKEDYFKLLRIYTMTHRKDGMPYIAEACHPDTGSWSGHDHFNHSEHYFHSGYNDLVITGLVGLHPQADNTIEVEPLIPDEWDYFALDDVAYKGCSVSIVWDKDGSKYGKKGLTIYADGKVIANSPTIKKLNAAMPEAKMIKKQARPFNYAANNKGNLYPRILASYTADGTTVSKLNDGQYWYLLSPPNRWSCVGSSNEKDSLVIDLGIERTINQASIYILEDEEDIKAPEKIELMYWDGKEFKALTANKTYPEIPTGHRPYTVDFDDIATSKIKVILTHKKGFASGLTEIELWGKPVKLPLSQPGVPAGNIAYNKQGQGYPKPSASYSSRFDRNVYQVNDGVISYNPSPQNRWTAYQSPNPTDSLAVDFGEEKKVSTIILHIFDDKAGVHPPKKYTVQYFENDKWIDADVVSASPSKPTGSTYNIVQIKPVKTQQVRVVFEHKSPNNFSGLTEIEIWSDF